MAEKKKKKGGVGEEDCRGRSAWSPGVGAESPETAPDDPALGGPLYIRL